MRRLSISLLVVVLLATIGLGWAIDQLFVRFTKNESDSLQIYKQLGQGLVQSIESESDLSAFLANWPNSDSLSMQILSSDELALPDELNAQLQSGEPLVAESESGITLFFAVPMGSRVLALFTNAVAGETRLRAVLTSLFYIGMILLVFLWIYPLARRLLALGKSTRAFGEGDLNRRVKTSKRSYLYGIETEFNSMADRIQFLVADNKMLASAVSHDLRTPLARLRFGIDLLDETTDEKIRSEYQTRISADLTAMEELVQVLLEYARLDQQLSDMPRSAVDLSQTVQNGIDLLSVTGQKRIEFSQQNRNSIVDAHPRHIKMLVNNLLQNAVNYSDSAVLVTLIAHRSTLVLSVEDDGPGVPEDQRVEVLKPFVRGKEENRAGSRKGYGMGLAIVNRIAQWHKAEFSVEKSDKLGGAKFTLRFKTKNAN